MPDVIEIHLFLYSTLYMSNTDSNPRTMANDPRIIYDIAITKSQMAGSSFFSSLRISTDVKESVLCNGVKFRLFDDVTSVPYCDCDTRLGCNNAVAELISPLVSDSTGGCQLDLTTETLFGLTKLGDAISNFSKCSAKRACATLAIFAQMGIPQIYQIKVSKVDTIDICVCQLDAEFKSCELGSG